jgi:uncharacterized protein (DUF1015 family)
MAHIAPFRALRYDPARVTLSDVVTQPYDKITPAMQEAYYAANPHNLVRIILGKQYPEDHPGDSTYTRAAAFFEKWRQEGIFLQERQPSLYLYTQRFQVPGGTAELERRGFIALGQIEDYSAGVVFRHEQTLAKPKADRLELLRATRAHFGQIFVLYTDPAGEIDGLLATEAPPDIEVRDEYGVVHRVRKVSDPALVALVRNKMGDKKLIIADGHHRYETALTYRNERRSEQGHGGQLPRAGRTEGAPTRPGSEKLAPYELAPYELAMMTFVNMDSPGLVILPTHRVVHGLASFSEDAVENRAGIYFTVCSVDPSLDATRATAILREASATGTALLAVTKRHAFLLNRPKANSSSLFRNLSLRQQSLDVVQLHKCLLEGALELSEESIRNQENIRYLRDAGEAMEQVRRDAANVAFLMHPARMEQVRDIAFAGEVLPQKSTDFYPKLLSGLAIYALQ